MTATPTPLRERLLGASRHVNSRPVRALLEEAAAALSARDEAGAVECVPRSFVNADELAAWLDTLYEMEDGDGPLTDRKWDVAQRARRAALATPPASGEAGAVVCGACGDAWTGQKCGQAENGHSFPVCYPVATPPASGEAVTIEATDLGAVMDYEIATAPAASGDDIEQIREQADAWEAVFKTLLEVAPGWHSGYGCAMDKACDTIRRLAAVAPAGMEEKPRAYMRRWAFDGEKPYKVLNEDTGRMHTPFRFKLMEITPHRIREDDVPLFAAPTPPVAPAGMVLPFDDDVRNILGRPCFTLIRLAQALRRSGMDIKTRAEDEQAACLHWLLTMYFKHGSGWCDAANAWLAEHAAPTPPATAGKE